jgi:hypothetical protein
MKGSKVMSSIRLRLLHPVGTGGQKLTGSTAKHWFGPEFAAILWSEGLSRRFDNRLPGQDERDFGSSFATLAQQQQAASL